MLANTFNWIVHTLAHNEVIDLDFITTDLVDIPMTEVEQMEGAMYDAMTTQPVKQTGGNSDTPVGKQVF